MSRRDLRHVLDALWELSGGAPDVAVPVSRIDQEIGRGHGDMRTPLNLESLRQEGHAAPVADGSWALTRDGVAWLQQDRELSDR